MEETRTGMAEEMPPCLIEYEGLGQIQLGETRATPAAQVSAIDQWFLDYWSGRSFQNQNAALQAAQFGQVPTTRSWFTGFFGGLFG